jgi:antitoxin VapB
MTKTKVFRNNRSQAVRLPKEFRFRVGEVFVRRVGRDVVLSTRPVDWSEFLASGRVASADFLKTEAVPAVAPELDRWGLPRG